MASDNGDKFIRGILWTLIVASFGWASVVGAANLKVTLAHCDDSRKEFVEVRREMIIRDEGIVKAIAPELKEISNALSELKNDVKWIKKVKQDEANNR